MNTPLNLNGQLLKSAYSSFGKIYLFILGLTCGAVIDTTVFRIHQFIKPPLVTEDSWGHLALLGFIQAMLNLVLMTILGDFHYNVNIFTMGLFMVQVNFFKHIYQHKQYLDVD